MPLTSFFTPKARPRVAALLEGVFQGPEVAELTLTGEPGFGKPELQAKLLILPLRSDLGDVTRALGCLVADGQIGRVPRRFDVTAEVCTRIAGAEGLRPPAQPLRPAEPERSGSGFAERAPLFQPGPAQDPIFAGATPEERRAMLRVVSRD